MARHGYLTQAGQALERGSEFGEALRPQTRRPRGFQRSRDLVCGLLEFVAAGVSRTMGARVFWVRMALDVSGPFELAEMIVGSLLAESVPLRDFAGARPPMLGLQINSS